nr:cation:proton antiporter [Lachnospiraceae bacterium]
SILNAVLFVMIALLVLNIELSKYVLLLVPVAILAIIISRAFGVFISSLLTGRKMPGNYSLREYVCLMTWSALKGGLSLALALGTRKFLPHDVYLIFMNVTFVTIFFTVLVQGLTIKKVYFSLEKHKTERLKREKSK